MNVFIDNNVWNYFFENQIQIDLYFPKEEFKLFITQQGEYEVEQMPDSCAGLKKYVKDCLKIYVTVERIFGFYNPSLPADQQRVAGFDQGRFSSDRENIVRSDLHSKYGSQKKTKRNSNLV